jgi:hypothetical protein
MNGGVLRDWQVPRVGPTSLVVLGVLSVLLFWVPLLAPLIQLATLLQSLRTARWGLAAPWSLAIGVGGAIVGFGLFLALEYLWVI